MFLRSCLSLPLLLIVSSTRLALSFDNAEAAAATAAAYILPALPKLLPPPSPSIPTADIIDDLESWMAWGRGHEWNGEFHSTTETEEVKNRDRWLEKRDMRDQNASGQGLTGGFGVRQGKREERDKEDGEVGKSWNAKQEDCCLFYLTTLFWLMMRGCQKHRVTRDDDLFSEDEKREIISFVTQLMDSFVPFFSLSISIFYLLSVYHFPHRDLSLSLCLSLVLETRRITRQNKASSRGNRREE